MHFGFSSESATRSKNITQFYDILPFPRVRFIIGWSRGVVIHICKKHVKITFEHLRLVIIQLRKGALGCLEINLLFESLYVRKRLWVLNKCWVHWTWVLFEGFWCLFIMEKELDVSLILLFPCWRRSCWSIYGVFQVTDGFHCYWRGMGGLLGHVGSGVRLLVMVYSLSSEIV